MLSGRLDELHQSALADGDGFRVVDSRGRPLTLRIEGVRHGGVLVDGCRHDHEETWMTPLGAAARGLAAGAIGTAFMTMPSS